MKINIKIKIKNIYSEIYNIIYIIFHFSYWLMNDDYNPIWDFELNNLMLSNKFKIKDYFTASLGNRTIWISNHPYASFSSYKPYVKGRPSRKTIRMAYNKLLIDIPGIK